MELLLIGIILFGSLVFWPLMRFGVKSKAKEIRWLKWQFIGQLLGLACSFAAVYHYFSIGHRDRLHSYFYPYSVGVLSWTVAIIILVIIAAKREL